MATLTKPRSLLQTIIASAAERLSQHPSIPPENREAFRVNVVSVIEQQISAVIGSDTITVSGWVMPPSQRAERRDRIEAALRGGESVKVIAGRELVSQRWVRRLQAEMGLGAEQSPPEQFRGESAQ